MTTHTEPVDTGHTPEAATGSPTTQEVAGADAVTRTRSRGGKNVIFRVFPEEHDDIASRAAEAGLIVFEFIGASPLETKRSHVSITT